MTATAFRPDGSSFELRLQTVLKRREQWLAEHPEAASCTLLIHASRKDSVGYWLTAKGAAWAVLPRGGPAPDEVWYMDSADVEAEA
jgi:hypothetical protein